MVAPDQRGVAACNCRARGVMLDEAFGQVEANKRTVGDPQPTARDEAFPPAAASKAGGRPPGSRSHWRKTSTAGKIATSAQRPTSSAPRSGRRAAGSHRRSCPARGRPARTWIPHRSEPGRASAPAAARPGTCPESLDALPSTPMPTLAPARCKSLTRQNAAAQAHVGVGTMADADAPGTEPAYLFVGEMDAVREPHPLKIPAAIREIFHGSAPEMLLRINVPRPRFRRSGCAAPGRARAHRTPKFRAVPGSRKSPRRERGTPAANSPARDRGTRGRSRSQSSMIVSRDWIAQSPIRSEATSMLPRPPWKRTPSCSAARNCAAKQSPLPTGTT